ncbi:MAG: lipopolysaccharide heptosyltransferase II [Nitrospirae bacterium]|nr:lipopolysaccharide heptosyltransferase II [Nitrospirota bacterium]
MLPVSDVHHLLFIKPSSLGDIVHALPTLDALRSRFPQARITWLVKQEWAGFVQRVEGVDEICAVAPGLRGWFGKVPRLRAEAVDLAVDLQGLFRSGVMARLSGAPVRLGFADAREGSPLFYSHRVAVPSPDMHAVDRYLLVAEALGAPRPSTPRFRLSIPRTDDEAVNLLLTRRGITSDRPWIAMNVSARWPTKCWPIQSFAKLIDQLNEAGIGPVVLFGAPSEREAADAVSRLMAQQPISLVGQTGIGLLPALLRKAAVLVTNDSGPMHVAAAVGTPVVAIFGPTSPARTGPYGASHQVLRAGIPCSPCFSRRCTNVSQLECLTAIAPSDVFRAVQQVLQGRAKVEAEGSALRH